MGMFGSLYEKWAAERAALRVVDVTSVASEIIVDLPFESERTDEDIASAAANHLNWNSRCLTLSSSRSRRVGSRFREPQSGNTRRKKLQELFGLCAV